MLDKSYHEKNLKIILRDINTYTQDEYSRALLRLVCVADPIVMTEPEFTQQRLKAISDQVNGETIAPDNVTANCTCGAEGRYQNFQLGSWVWTCGKYGCLLGPSMTSAINSK